MMSRAGCALVLVLVAAGGSVPTVEAADFTPQKGIRLRYGIYRNGKPTAATYTIKFEADSGSEVTSWCDGPEAEGLPFAPGVSNEEIKRVIIKDSGVISFSVLGGGARKADLIISRGKGRTEVHEKSAEGKARLRTIILDDVRVVTFEALLLGFQRQVLNEREVSFWIEEGGEAKRGKRLEIMPAKSGVPPAGSRSFNARKFLVENVSPAGQRFLAFEVYVNRMGLPVFVTTKGGDWSIALEGVVSVVSEELPTNDFLNKYGRRPAMASGEQFKHYRLSDEEWEMEYTKGDLVRNSDLLPSAMLRLFTLLGGVADRAPTLHREKVFLDADGKHFVTVKAEDACRQWKGSPDFKAASVDSRCEFRVQKECCTLEEIGNLASRWILKRGSEERPKWLQGQEPYTPVEDPLSLVGGGVESPPSTNSDEFHGLLEQCISKQGVKPESKSPIYRTAKIFPSTSHYLEGYDAPRFCLEARSELEDSDRKRLAQEAAAFALERLAGAGAGTKAPGAEMRLEGKEYRVFVDYRTVFEDYAAGRRAKEGVLCDVSERVCFETQARKLGQEFFFALMKQEMHCETDLKATAAKVSCKRQIDLYPREELFR